MDGIKLTSRTLNESAGLRLCEYDTYGRRMAGCFGDNALAVFDRAGGHNLWEVASSWQAEGRGRVTQVAWAHTEFGQVLAVATDLGEVSIYEERGSSSDGDDADDGSRERSQWELRVRSHDSASSVSDIRFGPKQMGLCLAAAYDDGYVRLYKCPEVLRPSTLLLDNDFRADDGALRSAASSPGARCLAWRPWSAGVAPALIVGTGSGCSIWHYCAPTNEWRVSASLVQQGEDAGEGEVTAVAWAPTLGRPCELVAAACGDSSVRVFSCRGPIDQLQVGEVARLEHPSPVWKVDWNMLGNWLATSCGEGDSAAVRMWRQDLAGRWAMLHCIQGGNGGGGGGMNS